MDPDPTAGGGTVHIRASKTDQHVAGATRYIGPGYARRSRRSLAAAGHTTGAAVRVAVVADVMVRIGGHSLRVGSACDLAKAGASVADLQQTGGWRSPVHRDPCLPGPGAPIVARRRPGGHRVPKPIPALSGAGGIGRALAREGYPRCWQQAAT